VHGPLFLLLPWRIPATSSDRSASAGTPATSTGCSRCTRTTSSLKTGEHWPEQATLQGKDAFRESIDEWLGVWESIAVETDYVEAFGDRVVAHGAWRSTGRLSGVEGTLPIHIVFTVRDGKIARVDWCQDHDEAVAAARDA
jgi:hypothetical protein